MSFVYFKNEKAFTRWVLKQARLRGWLAAHPSNMSVIRRSTGETFAIPDKDADGLPDVIMVHPQHGLVFAELKMPGKKPDAEQLEWLRRLRSAGAQVFVWDTGHQTEIIDVLDGKYVSLLALAAQV